MAEACLDPAAGGNSTSLVSSGLNLMEAHSREIGDKRATPGRAYMCRKQGFATARFTARHKRASKYSRGLCAVLRSLSADLRTTSLPVTVIWPLAHSNT